MTIPGANMYDSYARGLEQCFGGIDSPSQTLQVPHDGDPFGAREARQKQLSLRCPQLGPHQPQAAESPYTSQAHVAKFLVGRGHGAAAFDDAAQKKAGPDRAVPALEDTCPPSQENSTENSDSNGSGDGHQVAVSKLGKS